MTRELMVLEDSDDDYESFMRTCKVVGFTGSVRRFTDAEDALAHLKALDWTDPRLDAIPALILLDLNMPGMDGREFLQAVKGDPMLLRLPVVVYTTSSNEQDIAFCYRHHANAYHLKAMDVDRLEADVRALVDFWFSRVVSPVLPALVPG